MRLDRTIPQLNRGLLVVVATIASVTGQVSRAEGDKPVEYQRDVLPIFAARCYQCHGPAKEESKFRLDLKERALAGGASGQKAIVPGEPEKSQLIRFVRGECEDKVMPAEGERLTDEQIELLTRWVKEGAKWPEEGEKHTFGEPGGVSPRVFGATIRSAPSAEPAGLRQPLSESTHVSLQSSPPGLPRRNDDLAATPGLQLMSRLRRPSAGGATASPATESSSRRDKPGGDQESQGLERGSSSVTRPPAQGRQGEMGTTSGGVSAGVCGDAPRAQSAEPAGLRQPLAEKKIEEKDAPKRIAAIVTVYNHNSHADVIVSRLFQTYTLDGKGENPRMKLMSVFTDQVFENDTSRRLSKDYGFSIHETVADALTLGTGELAVDGVLLVAEHGKYPASETGSTVYPKRRLFDEIVAVFKKSGRVTPLFIDKHLADNWQDAKHIYDTCRELKIPLMAGSSLPVLWRYPPEDVKQGAKLKEIVAVSYHTLDGYGFHALEMVQALAEQRAGGETGIKQVQTLTGDAVWAAGAGGTYDPKLLDAALARLKRPPSKDRPLKEQLAEPPVLWVIDYADGLRANIFTLNYAVGEWAAAWKDDADTVQSSLFYTQEARPLMHFTYLVRGIDEMLQSGEPAWPAERTLLTSGVLDSLLISQKRGGELLPTPHLDVRYESKWRWTQPPPPPDDRPLDGQ